MKNMIEYHRMITSALLEDRRNAEIIPEKPGHMDNLAVRAEHMLAIDSALMSADECLRIMIDSIENIRNGDQVK